MKNEYTPRELACLLAIAVCLLEVIEANLHATAFCGGDRHNTAEQHSSTASGKQAASSAAAGNFHKKKWVAPRQQQRSSALREDSLWSW